MKEYIYKSDVRLAIKNLIDDIKLCDNSIDLMFLQNKLLESYAILGRLVYEDD